MDAWLAQNKNFVIDPATGKLIDLSKGESGTQVTQTANAQPPTAAAPAFPSLSSQLSTFEKQAGLLADPSNFPKTPGVQATPVDKFRDRMAYRQEIRNEILDNQLDDRHDLNGNTLYRLKFEAHVLPEDDTSGWAVIELEPERVGDKFPTNCDYFAPTDACRQLIRLYRMWTKQIEDAAQERIRTDAIRFTKRSDIALIDPVLRPRVE